ncbi:amidohydrolase family protein [Nocardiopsis salina]|uniref:amidohydrolase family protein n=1 Tax=Nocardiopsis salina TaxID=245836 RepID=UPI0019553560|nr:amidohydrolase family protein [Nocardiopsis salina]
MRGPLPLITEHRLEWVNGAPVEDATATLHLLEADVPRRFPRLRFHIAHLGGDLPLLAQRIEDNYEDWNAFPASPNAVLRSMWFDAANFHTPSLQLAAATLGASQVLAGSDHPYFQREKYVRAFEHIRRAAPRRGRRGRDPGRQRRGALRHGERRPGRGWPGRRLNEGPAVEGLTPRRRNPPPRGSPRRHRPAPRPPRRRGR